MMPVDKSEPGNTEAGALFDMLREVDVKVADALAHPSVAQQMEFEWGQATAEDGSRYNEAAETSVGRQL